MDLAQNPELSAPSVDQSSASQQPPEEAASQEPTPGKVEVATVAAATSAAARPSADSLEALRLFRSSLLDMVGVSSLCSDSSPPTPHRWAVLSSKADDLSSASLIAKYVSLWSVLEKPENQKFSVQALIGLQMLQGQSLLAASKVFKEIEFQTSTPAALIYVMKGVRLFIMGLIGFVMLLAMTAWFLSKTLDETQQAGVAKVLAGVDDQWASVLAACVAGMFGSVVSLLLRISEFESTKGRSQMFLKLTGATLPIVGGVFGAFVASLFCAKIVNINIGEKGFGIWAFVAIGFLSGFSERFSRSFVQLAEKKFGGGEPSSQVSIATKATVTESGSASGPTRSRRGTATRRPASHRA